ncbi:sulfite exporter TauE/SafE family protein [Faecalicatena contorta]|uniref:sulfite exporter TauE/SafE family protein n=1 Tax=Faecalicatena contorta TaxID=39482 RepID=UPI00129DD389|nr:sulfite exporter TauE/SafE family protein [Faecalicatena contorta]MRM89547.1 sulfite exporter TauE/SafE family protein [Faecalicatena contorta]
MKEILFYLIIFVSNVIQGITGFAGTILAMPFGIMLVGYDVAKPVLNVLGLAAGLYVLGTHGKYVNRREFGRIITLMGGGILAGIFLKSLFAGKEALLYKLLGVLIIGMSIRGYQRMGKQEDEAECIVSNTGRKLKSGIVLAGAGVVHGMFVCGGPLLIGYLSSVIKGKVSFRATISTVWVVLNTVILADDIRLGLWTPGLLRIQVIALPFLAAGMVLGAKLYQTMSQQVFMKLTYILLFISGASLFLK